LAPKGGRFAAAGATIFTSTAGQEGLRTARRATIASVAAAAATPIARSRTSPPPSPATPSSSAATPAAAATIPTENGQTRRAGGSTDV
jgi:hypothetical protein